MNAAERNAIAETGRYGDAIARLVRMVKLAVVLACAAATPAQAAERCHDKAAMYQLSRALFTAGLDDRAIAAQLAIYPFGEMERKQAVERVKTAGDLGYMSARTLYRHVYLECRGAA